MTNSVQFKGATYNIIKNEGYCLIGQRPKGKRTYRIFFKSNGKIKDVIPNFADYLSSLSIFT